MQQTHSQGLYKRLALLALPIALQNVISFGVGLADNLMVGKLGESALSGVYVANQISNILGMLVIGFGTALVILASQYWGRKDTESVKTIVSMVVKIAFVVGIGFCLTMQFGGRSIFGLMTDEKEAIDEAVRYIKYVSIGYIFMCVTNVLLASMRCVGTVRIGLIVSSCAFVANVFLNGVLIFGLLGFPALGVAGAAIATLTARIVEFVIVIVYVLVIDKKLLLKIRDITRFNAKLAFDFFKYGAPVILGDVLWGFGGAAQGAILGHLGKSVMSASSMANNVFQIFSVFVYGTANAAGVIIGHTVGEGDMPKLISYAKRLQLVFVGVGICSSIVLFFGKYIILGLYTNMNADTMRLTRQFMNVLTVTIIGTAYQMSTLTGIVRAGGATHFVLINDLIWVWVVIIPSSYLAAYVFHAEPWVVFMLLKGDQIYKCVVAFIKCNRFKWMKKLTRDELVKQQA